MPQNATSLKAPAVKAAVALKRGEGKSKAQIAREMKIDRETVTRILSEPEISEAIEASRSRCVAMLPKAERAVERQLEKGDGDLGLRLLEKSGVLAGPQPPRNSMTVDVHLYQALATFIGPIDSPTANQQSADKEAKPIIIESETGTK